MAVAALFIADACGARTAPYLGGDVQAGQKSSSGGDTSNTVAGGDSSTGSGTETGGATASGTNTGGGTNTNTGTKSGGGGAQPQVADAKAFDYSPKAEAAACPGSNGNTASDVGITPTEITVGNVSGLSGVITNSFEHGPAAVQALFAAVNAAGGICGRKLKLIVEDDGQDAARNAADVNDLKNKVFAFVGSTSDADNAGVQAMVDAKVPDVGFAINANRGQSPVFWSANGSTLYTQNGKPYSWNGLQNGLKDNNDMPKRLAVLSYSIPISADAAHQFAYTFKQAGAQICFEDYSISPATASLDSDVLQMKQNNCDGVTTTMDISGNTKLLQSIQRQNYHMPYVSVTFVGYDPAQIDLPGKDAAQGLRVTLPFVPFSDDNTVMKLYKSQVATYQPNSHPSGFGVEAWAAGQMFIYALLKAGRNPTRASITAAFNALENYDTGGAFSPTTPRLRRPNGPCIVETEVKGDDFIRRWPKTGMYCNAQLVPASP
ncbi:MAG: ABC transporter substrate-binding protein [Actinobacteria bacterium]|nr:ABC transporter substrate-binding protein [Actinomycetota bacterium]